MKEYKVITEFGSAKKGDTLIYNAEQDLYTMDINENGSGRYMAMDEECAQSFLEKGNLICIDLDNEEVMCESCDTLLKLDQFVDDALAQYKKDNEAMIEEYATGSVPTCVKVEAETVYKNLTTLLKKIKNIIHE